MKNFNLIFSTISIFLNMSIWSAFEESKYPELAKFLQKYQCSEKVEKDALDEFVNKQGGYRDIPHEQKRYFMKPTRPAQRKYCQDPQFSRIINARRLQNYIIQNNLDRLGVAEKCLTHDLQFIVAKAVSHIESDDKVSVSQMQQLTKLVRETGYSDFAGNGGTSRNLYRDHNGKLIFIDTEDRSFYCPKKWWNHYQKSHFFAHQLEHLLDYVNRPKDNGINIKPEASKWLETQLELASEQAKNNTYSADTLPIHAIPDSSQYDDPKINFEKVKDEFDRWYAETTSNEPDRINLFNS